MSLKPILITLLTIIVLQARTAAQIKDIPVFTSGEEGHKSYRIPAIIAVPGGDLLAFCEGRLNNSGDFGDINLVMKRSKDNGVTWSAIQTIVDYDRLQAGNPAPVVDLTDPAYPKGRIFLFYNTGNNHEGEVRKGNGLREVWYKTSTDAGTTWSEPVNITLQVHRPNQPAINNAYSFTEDWRSYANTPGHAMQFSAGRYKGRIFVAANHSAGAPLSKFRDYQAHGYYTDDHGKTFHLGAPVALPGGNEATAAELPNGKLMMNLRNQQGDVKARIIAISSNGGETWDTVYFDRNLPDPVCEGSIITLNSNSRKCVLAFSNNADTLKRDRLTVQISDDEGRSWKKKHLLAAAPANYKGDYSAYSDLVRVTNKKLGILYEKDSYKQIVFTVINWKKL